MKEKARKLLLIMGVCYFGISTIYWGYKVDKAKKKINFYEKVMEEFSIGEFVHYPELFNDEGYVEQVKIHNCMWAIDDAVECDNKLYECENR